MGVSTVSQIAGKVTEEKSNATFSAGKKSIGERVGGTEGRKRDWCVVLHGGLKN